MNDETLQQRIARLESLRTLAVGDRIRVIGTGRTGTITKLHRRHVGFMVRWDEPVFGCTEARVRAHLLERES